MVLWVDIGMSMYNGCASGHCRVLSTSRPDLVVSFLVLQHNARKLVLLITIMDGWMTCDFTYVLFNSIVVDLLFYVHGKHLRSCRDGQLT